MFISIHALLFVLFLFVVYVNQYTYIYTPSSSNNNNNNNKDHHQPRRQSPPSHHPTHLLIQVQELAEVAVREEEPPAQEAVALAPCDALHAGDQVLFFCVCFVLLVVGGRAVHTHTVRTDRRSTG